MTAQNGITRKQLTTLQDKDDLLETIRGQLEGLWNVVYENPDATASLGAVLQTAQVMNQMIANQDEMMAELMYLVEQFQQQRDLAIEDRDFWANQTKDSGKKALAWALAWNSDISEKDALRVIDLLIGDIDLPVSTFTKADALDALRQLAREAAEEEMYLADYEWEDD